MITKSIEKIAIIVPNYNGINEIEDCLESITKQSLKTKVIIVDNGSVDNSVALIEKKWMNVILLKQPKNIGFAGGVNIGIKYCIRNNFTYLALFNNDAVADTNWLVNLVEKMKDDKSIGIVTGLLLDSPGKRIDTSGEQYSAWGLPFPRDRNENLTKAHDSGFVFGASGGASLYKTSMLRDIGLFDEDFFAYYEDVDISWRAQLAGYKIAYTPDAIAYHKRGVTSDKLSGFSVYQTFKNLPLLFIKNVPTGLIIPIGIKFYFAYWMMLFNAISKGNGKSSIKGACMSFVLGFKKFGERWQIQKSKRVTTKYIKSILWKDLPPDQTGLRKLRKIFTGKS